MESKNVLQQPMFKSWCIKYMWLWESTLLLMGTRGYSNSGIHARSTTIKEKQKLLKEWQQIQILVQGKSHHGCSIQTHQQVPKDCFQSYNMPILSENAQEIKGFYHTSKGSHLWQKETSDAPTGWGLSDVHWWQEVKGHRVTWLTPLSINGRKKKGIKKKRW